MPTCWAANEITLVVPPKAAETVALSNVSAFTMPAADSCSIWAWLSTPQGTTSLPRSGISRRAAARPRPCRPAAAGRDRLTGNSDVGLEHVAYGRDASTANEKIVGGLG